MKIYLGINHKLREIFRAERDPTHTTHGARYKAVIGPFQTMRGAEFMQKHGLFNPHCQSVSDAEKLAKKG